MTDPAHPPTAHDVEYKGAPLDSERGPGLGCFWSQVIVLGVFLVLTPLSVAWGWPFWLSAGLLFSVLILLLFAGQTVIFLLRLVAADRRAGRRRPLDSRSQTVGEMEDAADQVEPSAAAADDQGESSAAGDPTATASHDDAAATGAADGGVRE